MTLGDTDHVPEDNPAGARAQRPRVQSADRTIAILLAVAQSERGLTTKEISERLEIRRQTTYHLLHTLVAAGALARDRNRYLLGLRIGTLAAAFSRQLSPSEHLGPLVRALAHETGETAHAAGWWLGEITALIVVRGTNPVHANEVPQGYVGNAHARATGKLLLAFASPAMRQAYLDAHPLAPLTPTTITSREALDQEFATIREQGYASDDEEFAAGLCCLAVPFDAGYSPFVLGLSSPRERFAEEHERYLAIMRRMAGETSSALEPGGEDGASAPPG